MDLNIKTYYPFIEIKQLLIEKLIVNLLSLKSNNYLEGLVVKTTGSWYIVLYSDNKTIQCKLKGNFKMKGMKTTNPIAVGDKVIFQMMTDETMGLITDIKERFNCIIRKSTNLSKQRHILFAFWSSSRLFGIIYAAIYCAFLGACCQLH